MVVIKRRPPPPPPPSVSATPKYLITLPSETTLCNMGITFQSATKSGPVGVGANIQSISSSTEHSHTLEWKHKHGMKPWDVLYKINGIMVKSMEFTDILRMLNERGGRQPMTLIFEKNVPTDPCVGQEEKNKVGTMSDHNHMDTMRNGQDDDGRNSIQTARNAKAPISVPEAAIVTATDLPATRPMPMKADMESKLNRPSISQIRGGDILSKSLGEGDTSMEKNVLSSIFSPQNHANSRADDSILSEYSNSLREEGRIEQCPDLVTIQEGSGSYGTDSDGDGDGNDQEELDQDVMSVPQQDIVPNTQSDQGQVPIMNSPTFSYSVSTVHDREGDSPFLLSPLGAGITSLCIAHGDGNMSVMDYDEDKDGQSFDANNSSAMSSKSQYHDTQVQMLKEKYPYLSAASAMDCPIMSSGGVDGRLLASSTMKQNSKRVHWNRNNNRTSTTSKSCYRTNATDGNADELPCSDIHCSPMMESCSVSTVLISPRPGNASGGAPSSFGSIRYSPVESETPKTNRTNRSQNSNMSYNNIPIHMLDYRFVKECNCYETLGMIVVALKSASPPEFPSLLRLAEGRLDKMRDSVGAGPLDRSKDRSEDGNCDEIYSNPAVGDSKDDIPTHIHVEVQTSVGSELQVEDYTHDRDVYHDALEKNNYEEVMDNIVMAHAELKGQMGDLLHERDIMQENLTSQVASLKQVLETVEAKMQKQTRESNDTITLLTKQKTDAELEMKELRKSFATSSISAKDLMETLKAREADINNLASELFKARESQRFHMEHSESVQARLRAQVDNLTSQLRVQVKKTEATRTMVELEVRSEFRGRMKKDSDLMEALKSKLQSATDDVHTLYKENRFMATEFARVGLVSESASSYGNA